jgi:hypothetical protein
LGLLASLGCSVPLLGHVTTCEQTSLVGVTKVPCLAVEDDDGGEMKYVTPRWKTIRYQNSGIKPPPSEKGIQTRERRRPTPRSLRDNVG